MYSVCTSCSQTAHWCLFIPIGRVEQVFRQPMDEDMLRRLVCSVVHVLQRRFPGLRVETASKAGSHTCYQLVSVTMPTRTHDEMIELSVTQCDRTGVLWLWAHGLGSRIEVLAIVLCDPDGHTDVWHLHHNSCHVL